MEGKIPGIYRHFKGNYYAALAVATDSETLEEVVVYRALYGEGALWVRPRKMWEESVERGGKTLPRFSFVREIAPEFAARLAVLPLAGEEMQGLLAELPAASMP